MASRYRLGVDIGGTFTDGTLVDEDSGMVRIAKVLTTPADPAQGFIEVVERLLAESAVAPLAVRTVVHSTTVATNAIIEGNVAPTGFVTTEGFRDLLEIARQIRPSLYDLHFEKPAPLVPRYRCFGVPERLDAHGQVLLPLDEAAVRRVAEQLKREAVAAVAVCFLHAYVNPDHEQRTGRLLAELLPGVVISISSEVAPEIQEYVRASTTVINAAIQPVVARYLGEIEARLAAAGLAAELLVMQSNGGVFTFATARERPVFMVESGPAAGVVAANHLGTSLGRSDLLSLDMGGTTAKAGLVLNGQPRVTKDYEVGATARAGIGSGRGSGYPIRTPVIDLVEIGAGGGSIAWIDSGGGLRVGPRSAGAEPGPAAYRRGGTEPTITDANLVLGRLNPRALLGGELGLDRQLAEQVINERCARPLGLDLIAAAYSIVEIANAAMVNALRLVSVQRGFDPRDFALIAFGGAGPVHANRLAAELAVPTLIIPMSPGTFSALGLLVTDLKHEYARTLLQPLADLKPDQIETALSVMTAEGVAALERQGLSPADMRFLRLIELRYIGQSFELPIALAGGPVDGAQLGQAAADFHLAHERAYGFNAPGEPIELVNLRLTAIGQIAKPRLPLIERGSREADAAIVDRRSVYFAEAGGFVECPIVDRYRLRADNQLAGPAIIEEFDSTSVIHPGYRAVVDQHGNLLVMAESGGGVG